MTIFQYYWAMTFKIMKNKSNIIIFFNKLFSFYTFFIKSKKEWRFPQKCEVLFYDASAGFDVFQPYLNGYNTYLYYNRGELLNLPCLFLSFFKFSFWLGRPREAYERTLIKLTYPKVVITYVDNNSAFYQIKEPLKQFKTIAVQNGWRYEEDFYIGKGGKEKYQVDYLLVFNRAVADKYKEHIIGKTMTIGSVKNNYFPKYYKESDKSDKILYISNFRKKTNSPIHGTNWENFYSVDKLVVNWLGEWCTTNKKKLFICGTRMNKESIIEDLWYRSILSENEVSWEFLPKASLYNSYGEIENAEIVASIGSTLAYEVFCRGKKTCFLNWRDDLLGSSGTSFAWPLPLPSSGLFWSNVAKKSEINRIMDYLLTVSNEEWKSVHKKYSSDIMEYDNDNKTLKQLLRKLC